LRDPIRWDAARQRFGGVYDVTGRDVGGGRSLETFAFARVSAERIAIGELAPLPGGPIVPRSDALALDGSDTPYADLAAAPFATIADGGFGRIDADLVTGLDRIARLCRLPEGKLRQYLPGCAANAPALPGTRGKGGMIDDLEGPLVVHRRGGGIDLVIATGHGEGGWVVEQTLHAPAPSGPTRVAGALEIGAAVHGDTDGARDGFTPPCVPPEVAGGPDEAWQLTARHTGTYAIELDSDHDAVLAVVADDGTVLACNDDKHGFYRASIVHLPLRAGARVRVIVDAFDRAPQRYTLRAHEERVLANGGVLTLGAPVSDDTTGATDDHSGGCEGDSPDHAYTLDIAEQGRYAVRVETRGWPPLVSILRAEQSLETYTTLPPLETKLYLDPGTYTIVVDGCGAKAHGPYTLRVDRTQ
jgi:hypothetical protein